jgi:hypothetical protein
MYPYSDDREKAIRILESGHIILHETIAELRELAATSHDSGLVQELTNYVIPELDKLFNNPISEVIDGCKRIKQYLIIRRA